EPGPAETDCVEDPGDYGTGQRRAPDGDAGRGLDRGGGVAHVGRPVIVPLRDVDADPRHHVTTVRAERTLAEDPAHLPAGELYVVRPFDHCPHAGEGSDGAGHGESDPE